MYEFRFYDATEIRMGSPYNLAKIEIKGNFLPDTEGFDFQDKATISEDGHRLVLIEWTVSKNNPGFRVWDVDGRTRSVKKSEVLEGCCEKLYPLEGKEIYVDIDLGTHKHSRVSPIFK